MEHVLDHREVQRVVGDGHPRVGVLLVHRGRAVEHLADSVQAHLGRPLVDVVAEEPLGHVLGGVEADAVDADVGVLLHVVPEFRPDVRRRLVEVPERDQPAVLDRRRIAVVDRTLRVEVGAAEPRDVGHRHLAVERVVAGREVVQHGVGDHREALAVGLVDHRLVLGLGPEHAVEVREVDRLVAQWRTVGHAVGRPLVLVEPTGLRGRDLDRVVAGVRDRREVALDRRPVRVVVLVHCAVPDRRRRGSAEGRSPERAGSDRTDPAQHVAAPDPRPGTVARRSWIVTHGSVTGW